MRTNHLLCQVWILPPLLLSHPLRRAYNDKREAAQETPLIHLVIPTQCHTKTLTASAKHRNTNIKTLILHVDWLTPRILDRHDITVLLRRSSDRSIISEHDTAANDFVDGYRLSGRLVKVVSVSHVTLAKRASWKMSDGRRFDPGSLPRTLVKASTSSTER